MLSASLDYVAARRKPGVHPFLCTKCVILRSFRRCCDKDEGNVATIVHSELGGRTFAVLRLNGRGGREHRDDVRRGEEKAGKLHGVLLLLRYRR